MARTETGLHLPVAARADVCFLVLGASMARFLGCVAARQTGTTAFASACWSATAACASILKVRRSSSELIRAAPLVVGPSSCVMSPSPVHSIRPSTRGSGARGGAERRASFFRLAALCPACCCLCLHSARGRELAHASRRSIRIRWTLRRDASHPRRWPAGHECTAVCAERVGSPQPGVAQVATALEPR